MARRYPTKDRGEPKRIDTMQSTAFAPLRQTTFFDPPASPAPWSGPPHNHTDTSEAAAEQAAPKVSARMRAVLDILHSRGTVGATNDELTAITGWPIQSVCPITNALAAAGFILDSGERRPTRSGCPAKVWTITEQDQAQQEPKEGTAA